MPEIEDAFHSVESTEKILGWPQKEWANMTALDFAEVATFNPTETHGPTLPHSPSGNPEKTIYRFNYRLKHPVHRHFHETLSHDDSDILSVRNENLQLIFERQPRVSVTNGLSTASQRPEMFMLIQRPKNQ